MNNVYHGLTAAESELYTRLRGQQWLSEDGMAPELSKDELQTLARLEHAKDGATVKVRRLLGKKGQQAS